MYEKKILKNDQNDLLKKYVFQKIFWSIIVLFIVIAINILINKFFGIYFNEFAQKVSENYILTGLSFFISEIVIGIFPAELFMMIYQSKAFNDYVLIVLVLGIISSFCGFIAFLVGTYFNTSKYINKIVFQKKFKLLSGLFIKYGWVILILSATTPLPFALISFIAGYYKFSASSYLRIIVPVRVVRFFVSAFFIKYSLEIF